LVTAAGAIAQVAAPREKEAIGWGVVVLRAARTRGREEVWQHIETFVPLLGKLGVIPAVWEWVEKVESLRR